MFGSRPLYGLVSFSSPPQRKATAKNPKQSQCVRVFACDKVSIKKLSSKRICFITIEWASRTVRNSRPMSSKVCSVNELNKWQQQVKNTRKEKRRKNWFETLPKWMFNQESTTNRSIYMFLSFFMSIDPILNQYINFISNKNGWKNTFRRRQVTNE